MEVGTLDDGYIATKSASNAVCLLNAGLKAYFALSGRAVAMLPMQLQKGQTPYFLGSLPHQMPCKHRCWKTYFMSGQELNGQTYQTPSCKKIKCYVVPRDFAEGRRRSVAAT